MLECDIVDVYKQIVQIDIGRCGMSANETALPPSHFL